MTWWRRGSAQEEERGEDSACTCNFAHLLHASLGTRGVGGLCRKHLRRPSRSRYPHQLGATHPAHYCLRLAPRHFLIHINVEVSSHRPRVSVCASCFCSVPPTPPVTLRFPGFVGCGSAERERGRWRRSRVLVADCGGLLTSVGG